MSQRLYALCLHGPLQLLVFHRSSYIVRSPRPVEMSLFTTASNILDSAALCLSLWPAPSSAQAVSSVQTRTSVSTTIQIWGQLIQVSWQQSL